MISRDWFASHIEALALAIGAALGFKAKGEIQQALAAVEAGVQKAFGMNARMALGLPLKDFIALTCRGEEPSAALLSGLEKLFTEWADLLKAAGRDGEAALALQRAEECRRFKSAS
jgi:phosphotransferase system HPr-like phosphotransfer protein